MSILLNGFLNLCLILVVLTFSLTFIVNKLEGKLPKFNLLDEKYEWYLWFGGIYLLVIAHVSVVTIIISVLSVTILDILFVKKK
ncbi:hypothetical protein SAMN02745116_02332 [Pilibacter termitis]|uniref:Uncharacterized protein n=1 Tax=Pilibacter termitis TaxID=263852 RepID=A0A1T4QVE7_9ENTE|nr:hypothetical protein [Pilibacter termitis]SKA07596.1 hypothetical protein SAMN02745116_02332 [Pilibacter termitis]